MNKLILVAVAGLCFGNIYAKNPKKDKAEEGFVFTTVKENPITSIKNQNRSSTCWSFSSLGFLESELLREGNESSESGPVTGRNTGPETGDFGPLTRGPTATDRFPAHIFV